MALAYLTLSSLALPIPEHREKRKAEQEAGGPVCLERSKGSSHRMHFLEVYTVGAYVLN